MRHWNFASLLSLALGLLACDSFAGTTMSGEPAPKTTQLAAPPPAAAVAKLARSSNAFGCDLYRRLRRQAGNLAISPASITTALTMTWGGARGETAAQMGKVLHLEGTAEEVMATSGQLARVLQDPSRPIVFRIANRLFAEKTYRLLPGFLEKTKSAFDAPLEPLDFRTAPERSRARINDWVERQTERRIRDLIPPGMLVPDTRLVLVNAIYFLGDWAFPFEREATRPAPFHLTASKTKDVPTMHRTGEYRIAQQGGVTALEIPYQGGELSMMLVVPDQIEGLAAFEAALDAQRIDALASAMRHERVQLALPKFEVSPPGSLSLGEELAALGMPLAFDRFQADFTAIADPPDPADRLFIAEVFHKGFVRVDEKGTEAAAATAVMALLAAAAPEEPPRQLNVDRPFLFLIRDHASGLVLFLGRVSDPSRG